MARTLTRPMFRKGGMAQREEYMGGGITTPRIKRMGGGMTGIMSGIVPDAGLTPRTGYQEGSEIFPANTDEYRAQVEKEIYPGSLLGDTSRLVGNVNDALFNYGIRPLGNLANYVTGQGEGINTIKAKDSVEDNIDMVLKNRGVDLDAEEKPINIIKPKVTKKKVPQDPEKELLDVYADNKGIIDQVMGTSDEDTKKQLYLQLAKFGAGLAAQPGGDLVGAIGKAAADPLEGVGQVLASKQKAEKDIKMLALQKSFDDMKEPEQVKFVKAIQKEYGLESFQEAYDLVTKAKKSPALQNAENTYYRTTGENMGVSSDGFRREMNNLEALGLEELIGEFTRPDAALPEDSEDRDNGQYYVRPNGKAVRVVGGKLYVPGDPEFTAEIKATKKT